MSRIGSRFPNLARLLGKEAMKTIFGMEEEVLEPDSFPTRVVQDHDWDEESINPGNSSSSENKPCDEPRFFYSWVI